jgi:hypothetical protein
MPKHDPAEFDDKVTQKQTGRPRLNNPRTHLTVYLPQKEVDAIDKAYRSDPLWSSRSSFLRYLLREGLAWWEAEKAGDNTRYKD